MIRKTSILLFFFFITVLSGCSGDETGPASISDRMDLLIENNQYEDALTILEDENQEDPQIRLLKEKVHLNFGLHNMSTFDQGEMRTRMNDALRQFTEVLHINPENTVARERIEQIMSVYSTMPDRGPEEDVMEGLRDVGFDY